MKNILYIICFGMCILACNTTDRAMKSAEDNQNLAQQDTVRIANDEVEYEIIIIEPGFNSWLVSTARPEGYYSQSFLENRNWQYVVAWNQRVNQPFQFNQNLYQMRIDYDPQIDYGYEVNYKLYNYFIYFQLTYNQRLAGYVPRI